MFLKYDLKDPDNALVEYQGIINLDQSMRFWLSDSYTPNRDKNYIYIDFAQGGTITFYASSKENVIKVYNALINLIKEDVFAPNANLGELGTMEIL